MLSRVNQTIADGALGLASADPSQVHIKIGVCSAGTVKGLTFYTDPDKAKADGGVGPLVDAVVYDLQVAGGVVGMMRVNSSVAGVAGSVSVVRGGGGSSTGTVAVSGTPNDGYQFIVVITKDGANLAAATATFKYSVDGGDNYSPDIAVPTGAAYVVPNTGVTLTFANGGGTAFVTGDTHTFACTAPGFSSSDISDALDALRTTFKTAKFGFVHIVGAATNAAGSATIAAAVDTKMTAEENVFRYIFAIIEAADDTDQNLITAFTSFASRRVGVAAGYCELVANGKVLKRSIAWPAVARIAQQDIRRDLARTATDKEGGPLSGVTSLYRDEGATPALDDARFITLCTYPQQNGFYISNGRMMAPAGSDFTFLQYRRLMDRACTVTYNFLFPQLNDDVVRINDDGTIYEQDARSIETKGKAELDAELTDKKRVSATAMVVTRDNNMLSTQTLKVKTRIRPKGYAKFIDHDIGFENPSLIPAAP